MTVPFSLPLFTVAAVQSARASHARREEQEADDQRYATLRREQAQFRSLDDKPLLVDEPMTDQNHPITPPPELVHQWLTEGHHQDYCSASEHAIAQAARWGADQELEACRQISYDRGQPDTAAAFLRIRRPKPLSLKEQALEQLDSISTCFRVTHGGDIVCDKIRRALEALPDA